MEANRLRTKALEEINRVDWIPRWGKDRIYGMVENRPDWCISRQRSWEFRSQPFFAPPAGSLADSKIMNHVAQLFREYGSDIWYEKDAGTASGRTKCPSAAAIT
jgi:isoleucyl-tRNA synthetase